MCVLTPEYVSGYVCAHVLCFCVCTCMSQCVHMSGHILVCTHVSRCGGCPHMSVLCVAWCTYVACLCMHLCISRYVNVLMCMPLCLSVWCCPRVYVCDLSTCISMCVFFVEGGDVWLGQAHSVLFWIRQMKTSAPCFPNPEEGKQGSAGRAGVTKRWREATQTCRRFPPARGRHPKGGLEPPGSLGATGRASIRPGLQGGRWLSGGLPRGASLPRFHKNRSPRSPCRNLYLKEAWLHFSQKSV